MSYFKSEDGTNHKIFGDGGMKKVAQEFSKEILGNLPLDRNLAEASDKGSPWLLTIQIILYRNLYKLPKKSLIN